MKKILIIAVLACITRIAGAQNEPLLSKNGTPILPEEKDWAIGFDASPFFDVIKGVFSNADSSGSDYTKFTKDHPLTIYGKLVRSPQTIWRLSANLQFGSDKRNFVTSLDSSDGSSFLTPQYGNDVVKLSGQGITLGFGIEKRRGKGRVQGYYGPEVRVGFLSEKATINYANQITSENQVPSISPAFIIQPNNARITESKSGSQFNIGIRAFGGVEYFFMAKASIALELGWGISYASNGEPSSSIEYWDVSLNSGAGGVNRQRVPGYFDAVGKSSSFRIDSDNASGALNLFFYF
ncbi:MAG TPA: hypothetical protein VJY62_01760 [Bacteroidia bacterium]|nr:hypothetical protein [Bacteroidia bacterium]